MAGLTGQHWLQPDWDPGLTIAHLSLAHFTAWGLRRLCWMSTVPFCRVRMSRF